MCAGAGSCDGDGGWYDGFTGVCVLVSAGEATALDPGGESCEGEGGRWGCERCDPAAEAPDELLGVTLRAGCDCGCVCC